MSIRTLTLDDRLYEYLLDHSLREPDPLRRLREETSTMTGARMQISPEQGQFMRWLVEMMGVRKALEVGVFTGYSSTSVALSMPSDGRLIACDISEDWTRVARRYWREAGVDDRIELRLGPALTTLRELVSDGHAGTFDFAFVDADKEGYVDYYELGLVLLRSGGVLALDNTLWGGSVADPSDQSHDTGAIRALNERIHQDERVTMTLLPVGDGLTLVCKR